MAAAGFLSHYLSGPLPYVRRHITVNKNVLSASLNKTFPSFLPVWGGSRGGVQGFRTPLKFEKCPFYLGFLGFLQIYFFISQCYSALFYLGPHFPRQKNWIRPSL